ncbi:MAG: pyroglutamyl-peptidase I [Clostridia bacterium]
MKKLLVTAFEPFGGQDYNSSGLVLEKLPSAIGGLEVKKLMLPVLYKKAFDQLKDEMKHYKPDFVICLGQAGGRESIAIERIAININDSKSPDNDGIVKTNEHINANGEPAYFSNLPHERMMSAADGPGIGLSYSAGTYVCNDLMYRLMQLFAATGTKTLGGLINLPYTEKLNKTPNMALDRQVETLVAMLGVMEG